MNSTTLYTGIAVVLAIAVVTIFFFFPNYLHGVSTTGSSGQDNTLPQQEPALTPTTSASAPTSLTQQDIKVGTGATAQSGDTVVVEYIGKLPDGTVFDQSSVHTQVMPGCTKPGQFCFTLGAGQVIPGWDQGLLGMKAGGERVLVIPPSLAYGASQVGSIPPNSTLTFDVKLVGVNPPSGSAQQQYAPTGPAAE